MPDSAIHFVKERWLRMAATVGLLIAMVGALLAATASDADALTRVFRSGDGRLTLVCVYDDVTGELAYCDVLLG